MIPEFKGFHYGDSELSQPGFKLLATPPSGANQTELPTATDDEAKRGSQNKRIRRTFKYEPEEFFQEAKSILHPKDPQKALPLVLKEAVIQVMSSSH